MEMNFAFLEKKQEYELFSGACIDAERILESSPVMSAVASRKALELCVKWIYSIDSALEPIGNREGLQSLLHNNGFPSLMDITLWRRLQHIVRNGNESVHTSKRLTRDNAVLSLNILFDFVEWVDYCYGRDYVERVFDEKKIPDATTDMNVVQEEYRQVIKDVQKNADKIVNEKDKEIERLLALNKELRNEMKVQKARNIKNREYVYEPDLSEWTTRKRYIDADLDSGKLSGTNGDTAKTFYIGSKNSSIYFCLYEKEKEQKSKGIKTDIKNRFEIRLKNEKAGQTIEQFVFSRNPEQTIANLILTQIDFPDYILWDIFLDNVMTSLPFVMTPVAVNMDKTKRWLERQVMPSLLMIKEIEKKTGANYLEEIDRHTRLTEKQELKIKQMTTDIADMIEKDTAVPQGNDGIF